MKRLYAALHGTLGSYLRDALHEGSADVVACLHVPRASVFSFFILFTWWSPLPFRVRTFFAFLMNYICDTIYTSGTMYP
jgi:cell shape-determining protein MreD